MEYSTPRCVESSNRELCFVVHDKYIQVLEVMARVEDALRELELSTIAQKTVLDDAHTTLLHTAIPVALSTLLTFTSGADSAPTVLLALSIAIITALSIESTLRQEATHNTQFTLEELLYVFDWLRRLSRVYEVILEECTKRC